MISTRDGCLLKSVLARATLLDLLDWLTEELLARADDAAQDGLFTEEKRLAAQRKILQACKQDIAALNKS